MEKELLSHILKFGREKNNAQNYTNRNIIRIYKWKKKFLALGKISLKILLWYLIF